MNPDRMNPATEKALLYRRVPIPDEFVHIDEEGRRVGGDIRIGDLDGDGRIEFVLYKGLGGIKPSFVGAFDLDGRPLWSVGDKDMRVKDADGDGDLLTASPDRPGPLAIGDLDGDGQMEVLCFLVDPDLKRTSKWDLQGIRLVLLDGKTGDIKHQATPAALTCCNAYVDGEMHIPNYVHQRLMLADFRGLGRTGDFAVKLGQDVLAFDQHFELLWKYRARWHRYPDHAAYIPAVGDLDGDGRDELNGGHFGLDHDGTPLWERFLGANADAVLIEKWGESQVAVVSGEGRVLDAKGNDVLHLGTELVPHGQEIRCGHLLAGVPGPHLAIRYNGHQPDLVVVDATGKIRSRFCVDESPNNTGLEVVYWNGSERPALLFSPSALFDGAGRRAVDFPDLPPPSGGKMGWYHCFPADVCGDGREEVVLYDPYGDAVYIYTPAPLDEAAYGGYRHTPRQYNTRLLD
jgi:hypothetical protein